MPGLRDIAKVSGVSIATISRVLNNSGNVTEETRKKVFKAMKEVGYHRSDMINKSKKKAIGVIVPNIRGTYYNYIAEGIEKTLVKSDYEIFLTTTRQMISKEIEILDEFFQRRVDGIIICTSSKDDKYLEKLVKTGIPIVFVDREDSEIKLDSVGIDNYNSAIAAIDYLYNKGHRKIFFVGGLKEIYSSELRKKAIKDFKNKKSDMELFFDQGNFEIESGYNVTKNNIEKIRKEGITAIFYVNDQMALGGYRALQENKFKIPEDISIIGFDNAIFGRYLFPSLTTIDQPVQEIGVSAAELIVSIIENKNKSTVKRRVILPTKLIERESVKDLSKEG